MASTRENVSGPGRGDKKVLCVGNSCADFINVTKEFPSEDSDTRGVRCYWQRGGNASNSCTVLRQLSVACEYMGVLGSSGTESSWLKGDFIASGIDISHCVVKDVQCPVATCILSLDTGSRTILYYPRERPELTYQEFNNAFLSKFTFYSWVHFETCRNVDDMSRMMGDVLAYRDGQEHSGLNEALTPDLAISLEVEKPEILQAELLMSKADVVFVSKDFAKSRGYLDAFAAVQGLYSLCKPGRVLICAWGEQGAAVRCGQEIRTVAAQKVVVVDSLGAGDTFVAACIAGFLSQGLDFRGDNEKETSDVAEQAVSFGCRVAGQKCTMFGYKGLQDILAETE